MRLTLTRGVVLALSVAFLVLFAFKLGQATTEVSLDAV